MHFDVSTCQVVTGCFLPTSKSDGVVLSTNTSTRLWFLSEKHFNIDTHCSVSLKSAVNPTWASQHCIPARLLCQLLSDSFSRKTYLPVSKLHTPQAAEGLEKNVAMESLWQRWVDHSLLYDVLFLWKQQKDDVPCTKFSNQCNYKMAK